MTEYNEAAEKVTSIEETVETAENAPAVTAVTKKSKAKKTVGKTDGFCVYLGPSIRGVIQSGTVYPMAKEQAVIKLSSAVEKYPLVAQLIVPDDTLAEDRIKVKTDGNLLNVLYKKLASGKKN